jgi:hypothetical protein
VWKVVDEGDVRGQRVAWNLQRVCGKGQVGVAGDGDAMRTRTYRRIGWANQINL